MTTLEQVEKLREKTNVSYDDAKAALDATGGDLLEAIIYLEKMGKVAPPAGGGYYNSDQKSQGSECNNNECKNNKKKEESYQSRESFGSMLKCFGRFCARMIHRGNINTFEVYKGNELKIALPVTALALLLIFVFWVTVPLIIVGLFCGFRYSFNGPDLGKQAVNEAMDNAADTVENIKKSITEETK